MGEVVRSSHPRFAVGDVVEGRLGWQEYAVSDGKGVRKIDPAAAPISTALGVLGMPGLTAYFGLLEVGQPKAGETVVVSAASGAVGGIVGQIAKLKGCRAVGLAGSDAKVDYLCRELGYDAGINYRTATDLDAALRAACPGGIDVYFDNVGGRITEAVSRHVNQFARFAVCGLISQYNLTEPEVVPRNERFVLVNRVRIQGFLVFDFAARYKEGLAQLTEWVRTAGSSTARTSWTGSIGRPARCSTSCRGGTSGRSWSGWDRSPPPRADRAPPRDPRGAGDRVRGRASERKRCRRLSGVRRGGAGVRRRPGTRPGRGSTRRPGGAAGPRCGPARARGARGGAGSPRRAAPPAAADSGRARRGPPPRRGRSARALPAGVRRQRPAPRLPRRELARAAAPAGRAAARKAVDREWGGRLIRGWGEGWFTASQRIGAKLATLVGAAPADVVGRDSTSVNLFKLAVAALRARPGPADHRHRRDELPDRPLRAAGRDRPARPGAPLGGRRSPRTGSRSRTALARAIDEDTALVALSHVGVPLGVRVRHGRRHRARAPGGRARALGPVALRRRRARSTSRRRGADLAVGCTYKYLNGGPARRRSSTCGSDLHESLRQPIWGWFGQRDQFDMAPDYSPAPGILRFLVGTPPVLSLLAVEPGVDLLLEAGMDRVRAKSVAQTEYLIRLWERELEPLGFAPQLAAGLRAARLAHLAGPPGGASHRPGPHRRDGGAAGLPLPRQPAARDRARSTRRSPISTRPWRGSRASSGIGATSATRPTARPSPRLLRLHGHSVRLPDRLDAGRAADRPRRAPHGPGERVLIHADPTYFPALTEAVRIEINRAGAVEVAVHMLHPPGLERVRGSSGGARIRPRARWRTGRSRALRAGGRLHLAADELGVQRLADRGDHQDLAGAGGALPLGHGRLDGRRPLPAALGALRRGALDRLRRPDRAPAAPGGAAPDSEVEVTDPRGTRLRFVLRGAHFHLGNGDASKAFIDGYARAGSARDREVELPGRGHPDGRHPGDGRRPGDAARDLRGPPGRERAARVRGQSDLAGHQRAPRRLARGRVAEPGRRPRPLRRVQPRVNPKLAVLPGLPAIPYYGYGAGVIRVSVGDNAESGGPYRSSYHQWFFLTDATVRANGRPVVEHGRLVVP